MIKKKANKYRDDEYDFLYLESKNLFSGMSGGPLILMEKTKNYSKNYFNYYILGVNSA